MVNKSGTLLTCTASSEILASQNLSLLEDSTTLLWKCSFLGCEYTTKFKQNLAKHSRRHETNPNVRRPFPCTFENCEYRATVKWVLREHVITKHTAGREKTIKCPMCPSSFYTKAHLQLHITTHVKEKMFRCSQCTFETHTKICLIRHVKAIHDQLVAFTCPFPGCKYSTTHQSYIQKHRNTHDPDPKVRCPFPCIFAPDCTFRASYKKDLKRHIAARHEANRIKDVTCPLCPKAFYGQSSVRSHIALVHTKDQNFSCDKCNFRTHYANRLKLHRWIEHREGKGRDKKFKCDQCDYCSHSRSPLEVHRMTVHTSERRFKCDNPDCNYKTNTLSTLKNHMLTHEEDPKKKFPFACHFPGCDFRRKYEKEIRRHERNHEMSNRQLKCECCPRIYPDTVSLKFHNEMVHRCIQSNGHLVCDAQNRGRQCAPLNHAISRKILTVRLSKINIEIM